MPKGLEIHRQSHFNERYFTMSFDASKYTQSKWLKGSDLTPGQQLRVTVKAAYEHTFEQQNDTKPVLSFHEINQDLPLNKSQCGTMISNFGSNAALWIGQTLLLMPAPSNYAGKPTIVILPAPVYAPGATAHGIPAQQPPAQPQQPQQPQALSSDVVFGSR